MVQPVPFRHDLWAGLNYLIGDSVERNLDTPSWVPPADIRRLSAYRALAGMIDNVRRYWLPAEMWAGQARFSADGSRIIGGQSEARHYREYGDAALLVSTARTLAIGDEQTMTPDPDGPGSDDARAWVEAWAGSSRWRPKLLQAEDNAAGLGDGVLVVSWHPRLARPVVRQYDPGFYFPDWSAIDDPAYADWADEEYPPKVHLAWEDNTDTDRPVLHRATYRMERMPSPRSYPWGASPWTCRLHVQRIPVRQLPNDGNVYDLPYNLGQVVEDNVDLGVDFVPVIHETNDVAGARLFGRSVLLRVVQVLDDLNLDNTDLALTAQLVGSPALLNRTDTKANLTGGPGVQYNLGIDGDAELMDTSRALAALLQQGDRLERLLASRSRIAQVLLGDVAPDEVPSGYAMQLGFRPTVSLVDEMRLARREKHTLLPKFAFRLAQANNPTGTPTGETPHTEIVLGDSIPDDTAAVVADVVRLRSQDAISIRTAVAMLRNAGVHDADLEDEVAAIHRERVDTARGIVDSTGDVDAARAYLGLDTPPA